MKAKKIVLSGLFVAFGVLLPIIFHQFNMGGPGFLPMHIPVLIAGLFLGAMPGLLVGLITPILSSLLTGMPPVFPMLPIMIFELGAYGLISGLFSDKLKSNDYISLIVAMISGRLVAGVVVFVLGTFFGFKGAGPVLFVKGAIVTGLPGIIIQLVFVPPVAKLLRKHVKAEAQ
ncbi:MAG: ECF transporter S component [Tissierellaceae bacterium]|nr:ECF transporter S component [Tissierellaceae bacterium]